MRRTLLACLILATCDALSRVMLETPAWVLHPTPDWHARAVRMLAVVALVVAARRRPWAHPLALAATGCLITTIDSIDGIVQNPIAFNHGPWWLGINAADAAIVAGVTSACWILGRDSVRHLLHHHRNHTQAPNGALDSQAGACATGIPHGRNEQA